jgi:hypothetical protein
VGQTGLVAGRPAPGPWALPAPGVLRYQVEAELSRGAWHRVFTDRNLIRRMLARGSDIGARVALGMMRE